MNKADQFISSLDQPNSNPRAAKVVKSETNPGDIAMNDSCEPEPHEVGMNNLYLTPLLKTKAS